jgi:hypothetical protein
VIGADNFASLDTAERERGSAMNAHFVHCVRFLLIVAPENNRLAEQGCTQGRGAKFVAVGDGMPAPAEIVRHSFFTMFFFNMFIVHRVGILVYFPKVVMLSLRVADPHFGRYRDAAKLDRPAIFRFN